MYTKHLQNLICSSWGGTGKWRTLITGKVPTEESLAERRKSNITQRKTRVWEINSLDCSDQVILPQHFAYRKINYCFSGILSPWLFVLSCALSSKRCVKINSRKNPKCHFWASSSEKQKYRSSDRKRDCNPKSSTKPDTWTDVECWMEQILYSCQQNLHLRERERKGPSSALTAWWMGRNAPSASRWTSLCSSCAPCAGNAVPGVRNTGRAPGGSPGATVQAAGSCVAPKQCPVSLWQPR